MDSYLIAIRQALVLFPVLALFFTVPYVGYNYHKYGSILSLRILIVYSFMLYLLCVYCLVILPLPSPGEAAALRGHRAMQLIPFAFVGDIAEQSHVVWNQPGSWLTLVNNRAFLTTLFNLFMTLPFGMYQRYYFRCGWRKTLLLSFLLSLFFELTQLSGLYFIYPGAYRTFDVDDLIVNTAGSLLGYRLAHFVMRFLPSREEMDQRSFSRGRRVSALRRVMALRSAGGPAAVRCMDGAAPAGAGDLLAVDLPGRLAGLCFILPDPAGGTDGGAPADPAEGGEPGGGRPAAGTVCAALWQPVPGHGGGAFPAQPGDFGAGGGRVSGRAGGADGLRPSGWRLSLPAAV